MSIGTKPLETKEYDVGGSVMSWVHDEFTVSIPLCGSLSYSATYRGIRIDSSSKPLSYDASTRTFSVSSTDQSLIGSQQEFKVSASLTDYPSTVIPNNFSDATIEY